MVADAVPHMADDVMPIMAVDKALYDINANGFTHPCFKCC